MKKFVFLISSIIAISFNIIVGTSFYDNQSTKAVADNFSPTLITPANFTFTIWGIIFLMFIIVGVLNIKKSDLLNTKTLWYFVGSCSALSLWILIFQLEVPVIPTMLLFTILVLNVLISFELPSTIKHFYLIYTSWSTIASVISFTVLLQYDLGVKSLFDIPNPVTAILVLGVGVIIFAFLTIKFNSITPALVGAWSFFGINRVSDTIQPNSEIKTAAAIYTGILLVLTIMFVIKARKLKSLSLR